MNTQRNNPSTVDTQFDEWAKAVAHGLNRRKTLQLIGGTFTGALLALRGQKAWARPSTGTRGCGHICAPLFNPQNQGAFAACTQACEDCKSCQGTPMMTSTNVLVCNNATPCRNGGSLACCSGGQNCCGGVCCNADCCGGQCLPACTAGFVRDPTTCTWVSTHGPNYLVCQCMGAGAPTAATCTQTDCGSFAALDAMCNSACSMGFFGRTCFSNSNMCVQ